MRTKIADELISQGYKSLKMLVNECNIQCTTAVKQFCKDNNIFPDYTFPHGRGTLCFFSSEKCEKIISYLLLSKHEKCCIKRNILLNVTTLLKKYKISYQTYTKYGFKTEEDFANYAKQIESKKLSPETICTYYNIRLSTFKSYNPNTEPTEENIAKFVSKYRVMSEQEKKEHAIQLRSKYFASSAWKIAQQRGIKKKKNMSEQSKKEMIAKCIDSKIKNGTMGWNNKCRYLYNGKGYNKTELVMQLAHPDWIRNDSFTFQYEVSGQTHCYLPDFYSPKDNCYIEIKGSQFFDSKGNFIDPYIEKEFESGNVTAQEYKNKCLLIKAKEECMKKNNIILIKSTSKEVKVAIKEYGLIAEQYKVPHASYIQSPNKGKTFSDEMKLKLSQSRTRPFRCLNNNKVYNSYKQCAEELGIKNVYRITRVCSGKQKSTNGFRFEYV